MQEAQELGYHLTDLFRALGIAPKQLLLSERQVYLEIHPSVTGALSGLAKIPVLVAESVAVNIEPDSTTASGARVSAEIEVDSLKVTSADFTSVDCARVKHKIDHELLHTEEFPVIRYDVQEISMNTHQRTVLVQGMLTICGQSRTQYLRFREIKAGVYEAEIEVRQRDFGLTPLTGMMGGLKCGDAIRIRCVVRPTKSLI